MRRGRRVLDRVGELLDALDGVPVGPVPGDLPVLVVALDGHALDERRGTLRRHAEEVFDEVGLPDPVEHAELVIAEVVGGDELVGAEDVPHRPQGEEPHHLLVPLDVLVEDRIGEDAVGGVEVPGRLTAGEEGVEPRLRVFDVHVSLLELSRLSIPSLT